MSFINWFKTAWLTSEERQLLKEAKEKANVIGEISFTERYGEPKEPTFYRNILVSNRGITVVLNSGEVLMKQGSSPTMEQVQSANSEYQIRNLFEEREGIVEKTTSNINEERDLITSNLQVFKGNEDFFIKGNEVYIKGVNLALPVPVAASFIEILEKQENEFRNNPPFSGPYDADGENLDEQYNALKMFWYKLALNTLPQSREDLLVFVKNNDVRITPNGNLVLYRRIVSKDDSNKAIVAFISQQYFRIKQKHKKSPKNYYVHRDEDWNEQEEDHTFTVSKIKKGAVGRLDKLYKQLDQIQENDYTSQNNKGKHTIKIGSIYRIEDSEIDLNNGLCAAGGLHAAAVNYNYSGFGDTPVVVLVNPSKAITVPRTEWGKLRTTEMFVACINDKPLGEHWDNSSLSAFDEEYHDLTLQELEDALQNKSFQSLSVQENVPAVSLVDIKTIRNILKNRIQNVI